MLSDELLAAHGITRAQLSEAAAELGKRGGATKTKKKAKAARENGHKSSLNFAKSGHSKRFRARAHRLVSAAIANGTLTRLPCSVCGAVKSVAHHRDYRQPLVVDWFCQKHHVAQHRIEAGR